MIRMSASVNNGPTTKQQQRRVDRHLVSVDKNHTAALDNMDEAVAKLEAQRSSSINA
jgi:hypothetical protein